MFYFIDNIFIDFGVGYIMLKLGVILFEVVFRILLKCRIMLFDFLVIYIWLLLSIKFIGLFNIEFGFVILMDIFVMLLVLFVLGIKYNLLLVVFVVLFILEMIKLLF